MSLFASPSRYSIAVGSILISCSLAAGAQQVKPAPTPPVITAPKPAVTTPEETHAPIYALAFSLDGKQLAVGGHRQALIYDCSNWAVASTITGTGIQNAVRSLCYLPDGKRLALGSGIIGNTGNVMIWDPEQPAKGTNYAPAHDTVENIAFSKNGSHMLTASFDSKAHLFPWTPYPYGETKLEEHNGRVTAVAFSPKADYIFVTGAMDKFVKVWDYRTMKVVVNFDQSTAGISGLAFLANGDQFVGSSMDGNLYWWAVGYNERKRVYNGYPFRTVRAHEDGVTAFGAAANQPRVATGGSDHRVCVWNIDSGGIVREIKDVPGQIYAAALSPDGKIVAAGGRMGLVNVWDVETGKLLATITPPGAPRAVLAKADSVRPFIQTALKDPAVKKSVAPAVSATPGKSQPKR